MDTRAGGGATTSARARGGGSDTQPACFDCSICLEPVGEQQPVVTPCGHLYCRPCVRRWLRSGHPGAERCPVCKATVSEDRLVPLYGRGGRAADPCNQQSRRRRGAAGMAMGCRYDVDMQSGAALRSNAGCVIGSVAVAVPPWAFPDGRFPPRPALLTADDGGGGVGGSRSRCTRYGSSLPPLHSSAFFSSDCI